MRRMFRRSTRGLLDADERRDDAADDLDAGSLQRAPANAARP